MGEGGHVAHMELKVSETHTKCHMKTWRQEANKKPKLDGRIY
jgi:hypothetical protein